jgi:hypothetical protein
MRHETRPVTVRTRWLTIGEGACLRHRRALLKCSNAPASIHSPESGSFLADVDAEFEQFPVNARRTPQRVGLPHTADQITDFWVDGPGLVTSGR